MMSFHVGQKCPKIDIFSHTVKILEEKYQIDSFFSECTMEGHFNVKSLVSFVILQLSLRNSFTTFDTPPELKHNSVLVEDFGEVTPEQLLMCVREREIVCVCVCEIEEKQRERDCREIEREIEEKQREREN